jgi:putative spermidine/putrescine transport system substrate-binding protein
MSVVMMDEDVMLRAAGESLIAPATAAAVPTLGQLPAVSVAREGLWVRYKTPRTAIAFNSTRVPNGIAAWADIWEAPYRGKLAFPHMSLTSAPNVMTIAAHLETGKPLQEAQYDVDAGFRKLRALKPNVFAFYNNGQQGQALLEQGEAWALPGEITSYVLLRKSEGVPVDLATPREGSFGLPSCVALVKNGPAAELAQAFIDELLSVRVQELFATRFFDSPANPAARVGPGIVPPTQMFNTDWEFVAQNRAAWIERFDREIVA